MSQHISTKFTTLILAKARIYARALPNCLGLLKLSVAIVTIGQKCDEPIISQLLQQYRKLHI